MLGRMQLIISSGDLSQSQIFPTLATAAWMPLLVAYGSVFSVLIGKPHWILSISLESVVLAVLLRDDTMVEFTPFVLKIQELLYKSSTVPE